MSSNLGEPDEADYDAIPRKATDLDAEKKARLVHLQYGHSWPVRTPRGRHILADAAADKLSVLDHGQKVDADSRRSISPFRVVGKMTLNFAI
ncbi:hypothetical protein [Bradyrhizobium uaiense]|uniref:Uncharacterized protein n=1 Tax=Bradyrhizobium uaiense TaxID=2594946 RepID=A0A6P1BC51_9BRAD|nr:hypothetical protein [Bradyrhizobium uaiense]NEU95240.1 hypothetical protein [Bradyrhizobium uaiense]